MKKIKYLFVLLALFITTNVYAKNYDSGNNCYTTDYGVCKVEDTSKKIYDYANLFSESEESKLYNSVYSVISNFNLDFVILTINNNPESSYRGQNPSTVYADDFYDYNEFGYGPNHDGLILLIDMDERVFVITTTGSAINTLPNSFLEEVYNLMDNYMINGDYYVAASQAVNSVYSNLIYLMNKQEYENDEINRLEFDPDAYFLHYRNIISADVQSNLLPKLEKLNNKYGVRLYIITMPYDTVFRSTSEFMTAFAINKKIKIDKSMFVIVDQNDNISVFNYHNDYERIVERLTRKFNHYSTAINISDFVEDLYSYAKHPFLNDVWYGVKNTIVFSTIISIIIIIIFLVIVNKKYKAKELLDANYYIKNFKVTNQSEKFITTVTSRRYSPVNTSSGGSHSGGGHTSHSGSFHGGGGGHHF